MKEDRAYQFIDKLYQQVRTIKAIREAGVDIEGFSKRLRTAEFELLHAIDTVKRKEESERPKEEVKSEINFLPRHRG